MADCLFFLFVYRNRKYVNAVAVYIVYTVYTTYDSTYDRHVMYERNYCADLRFLCYVNVNALFLLYEINSASYRVTDLAV